MIRLMIVAAILLLFTAGRGPAIAASMEWDTRITCRVDETSSLTKQNKYQGDKKVAKIRSYFSDWLFNDDNYSQHSSIEFEWTAWTPDGPSLKITDSDTVHNSIRLLSRTKDSLIVVTSASDSLTAESWLFTLNFRHEAVIATQIQTNIGGVKGKVLVYICDFNDKHRQIKAPEPPEPPEPKDSVG